MKKKSEKLSNLTDASSCNTCSINRMSDVPKKKLFFQYSKVMFGELFGKLISPIEVYNNRMYFNLHCFIKGKKAKRMEKYTFSLSSADIEEIHVHFGRVPSFIAIETSSKFASVVCRRIGKDVLVPESDDMKKRYILLTGEKTLENNLAGDIEQCNFIMSVSSWARVNLLSYKDAVDTIMQIGESFPEWSQHIQRSISKSNTTSPSSSIFFGNQVTNQEPFSFICHKVKFGKLFGKSLVPVRVNADRMYFTFNCIVRRSRRKSIEKYTFSVGPSDVSNMFVYIGHMPSFLIVETTKKFADVACVRIGQNVLCPGSADPKRRFLFLLMDSCYNETLQKTEEMKNKFVQFVSPWTKLNVLTSSDALVRLRDLL